MDISLFEKFVNRKTITHLLKNYSEESIGIRHPSNPCGVVLRDSGMTDIYSGKSRIILDASGKILIKGQKLGLTSTEIYLNPHSINSLFIAGRITNSEIFNGKPITALTEKGNLEDKYFLSSKTLILDSAGGPCTIGLNAEDAVLANLDLNILYEEVPENIPHPMLSIAGIITSTLGVK